MRKIDTKYQTSGNITKVDGAPIPEDEPLFLFRAQDRLVVPTLEYYKLLRQKVGSSEERIALLQVELDLINDWQKKHPERTQIPE